MGGSSVQFEKKMGNRFVYIMLLRLVDVRSKNALQVDIGYGRNCCIKTCIRGLLLSRFSDFFF